MLAQNGAARCNTATLSEPLDENAEAVARQLEASRHFAVVQQVARAAVHLTGDGPSSVIQHEMQDGGAVPPGQDFGSGAGTRRGGSPRAEQHAEVFAPEPVEHCVVEGHAAVDDRARSVPAAVSDLSQQRG